jgi:hypothetical protein
MSATSKNTGDTFTFYDGSVTLKKRMYGSAPSFKRTDGEKTILSVTRCTGQMNKPALIPWAIGLVVNEIRLALGKSESETISKTELHMLINDAHGAPERAKESGGNVGGAIHDFAHDFALAMIQGEDVADVMKYVNSLSLNNDEKNKALNGISAFVEWVSTNKVEFKYMEEVVYYKSDTMEYYGFVDLIAKVNGKLVVVDYKSSKGVYNEQRYQVAGYVKASIEQGHKIKGAMIVNFNKETGELITKELSMEDIENDFRAFSGLYQVAERERELESEARKK